MNRTEIIHSLTTAGFIECGKGLKAKDKLPAQGFNHPKVIGAGSLWVSDNYLSATGVYKRIALFVASSTRDHKGYPVWQGGALTEVLAEIQRRYGAD